MKCWPNQQETGRMMSCQQTDTKGWRRGNHWSVQVTSLCQAKPLRKGKTSFYALAPLVKNALKDKGVSGDIKEYNTGSKICDIFEIAISQ